MRQLRSRCQMAQNAYDAKQAKKAVNGRETLHDKIIQARAFTVKWHIARWTLEASKAGCRIWLLHFDALGFSAWHCMAGRRRPSPRASLVSSPGFSGGMAALSWRQVQLAGLAALAWSGHGLG